MRDWREEGREVLKVRRKRRSDEEVKISGNAMVWLGVRANIEALFSACLYLYYINGW